MEDDVFDDHDGVVDHEAYRSGQAPKRHEVEALAEGVEEKKGDRDGDRDDQAGDKRRAPVAKKDDDDDRGQDDADENGVADAADTVADELGLIVEGRHGDAGGQGFLELLYGSGNFVGDGDGVAGGLARDVEQNGGMALGTDHGVGRLDGLADFRDVGDADGNAGSCVLDHHLGKLADVMGLRADECENELVLSLVEAGRVDEVGELERVLDVGDGDAGGNELGSVGDDFEVGNLLALHGNGADAVKTVERGLEVVGGDFP